MKVSIVCEVDSLLYYIHIITLICCIKTKNYIIIKSGANILTNLSVYSRHIERECLIAHSSGVTLSENVGLVIFAHSTIVVPKCLNTP